MGDSSSTSNRRVLVVAASVILTAFASTAMAGAAPLAALPTHARAFHNQTAAPSPSDQAIDFAPDRDDKEVSRSTVTCPHGFCAAPPSLAPSTAPSPVPLQVKVAPNVAPRPAAAQASKAQPRSQSYGPYVSIVYSLLSSGQAGCLLWIINRESGGNVHATNPGSGAYGIPQALPGSKMASFGADWRDNPWTQIRWMIWYVDQKYGSACGAQSFWAAHGWY